MAASRLTNSHHAIAGELGFFRRQSGSFGDFLDIATYLSESSTHQTLLSSVQSRLEFVHPKNAWRTEGSAIFRLFFLRSARGELQLRPATLETPSFRKVVFLFADKERRV